MLLFVKWARNDYKRKIEEPIYEKYSCLHAPKNVLGMIPTFVAKKKKSKIFRPFYLQVLVCRWNKPYAHTS